MNKIHSLNNVIFTIIFFIAVFIPLKAEENNVTTYSNEVAKVLQEHPITVELKKLKVSKQDWATMQEIELEFTHQNMCGIPYSVFIVFKENMGELEYEFGGVCDLQGLPGIGVPTNKKIKTGSTQEKYGLKGFKNSIDCEYFGGIQVTDGQVSSTLIDRDTNYKCRKYKVTGTDAILVSPNPIEFIESVYLKLNFDKVNLKMGLMTSDLYDSFDWYARTKFDFMCQTQLCIETRDRLDPATYGLTDDVNLDISKLKTKFVLYSN